MRAQQIRESFLDFFSKKGHQVIRSSSLMPKDDPTILFTNAGMNQFKNIFLGLEKKSYKRAVSVQKCMRVSGKHNDLEQVGITSKHHTFFEMLGNFSFGDYFKEEAVSFAWELITETFKMPEERLYATVYEDDDEAHRIWRREIGIPENRIFRFGEKDNFWAMGETGPCGPCSEIHIDLGPDIAEGLPYELIANGSDRFSELWNLVFMQFHRDEEGRMEPLPSPSIDTGMGLERVAAVLQGKRNNYDTDLFRPLIQAVCRLSEREYPSEDDKDISVRVIADHVRAVSFLLGDGIMPSNEGRGYVLRRLIRRAFRHGNYLGLEEPFLFKLVSSVCDIMKGAYPELLASAEYIAKVCRSEEKRFALTLTSGMKTFNQYVKEARNAKQDILPGKKVFKLYDTFGFPLDLSQELAQEEGLDIDREGFQKELGMQRRKARLSWKGDAREKEREAYEKLKDAATDFIGYDRVESSDCRVEAIYKDGGFVEMIEEPDSGELVLDKTPFYAEAGGQTGDSGSMKNPHFSALVATAYYPIPDLIAHKIKVLSGKLRVGDRVEASVDVARREDIRKNHTATHLLHASLRQVLGDHVKQAGSLVSSDYFRFDFTHFSPLSFSEIKQIEILVNEKIRNGIPVETRVVPLEKGLKEGATAIFEEKYGETVRMVSIDGFSKELCGGIHVDQTGQIGIFKIISESSIAAGMRRIEALTGEKALRHFQEAEDLLADIQKAVNASREDLIGQIEKLKTSIKEKEKELVSLRQKLANLKYPKRDEKIRKIKGISVLVQKAEDLDMKELRELADSLKQKIATGVIILGARSNGKAILVAAVTKNLIRRISAESIIKKLAPLIGGGGGGRPDFAQAGGPYPERLDSALKKIPAILDEMMPPEITPKGD